MKPSSLQSLLSALVKSEGTPVPKLICSDDLIINMRETSYEKGNRKPNFQRAKICTGGRNYR